MGCGLPKHHGMNCIDAQRMANLQQRRLEQAQSSSSSKRGHDADPSDDEAGGDDDDEDNPDAEGELDPRIAGDQEEEEKEEQPSDDQVPKPKRPTKASEAEQKKKETEDKWTPYDVPKVTMKMAVDKWVKIDPIPKSDAHDEAQPRNIPQDCITPVGYFKLFFTALVIGNIVTCTNLYGAWKHGNKWKAVTPTTIYHFIAIIMYMGLVWQPQMDSYWQKSAEHADIFGSPWVQNIMGRDRFKGIFSCLHFIDVTEMTKDQRTAASKADGFYLVKPFLDAIKIACKLYCLAGRGLSIDEMCVWFKGRHRCRCFNPNKPEKWHLKFYNLNDPTTGYCMNFHPYQGKDEELPEGLSATAFPVWKLTEDAELWHMKRTLATDNWYTSMEVVKLCCDRGFYFVGTVRTNKSGLPKKGMLPKKCDRGHMIVHKTVVFAGGEDKPVWFTGWFDNKEVYLLSTFPVQYDEIMRKVKAQDHGKKKGKIGFHEVKLDFPTSIWAYNKLMGGTDQGDQKAVYYRHEHQTRKWPHRIFTHFLNLCMVNAHILYCWQHPKITLLEFTLRVMKALAAEGQEEEEVEVEEVAVEPPKPVKVRYNKTKLVEENTTNIRLDHSLGHYPAKSAKRAHCPCCGVLATTKCVVCDVVLHMDGEGHENCFWRWHNMLAPLK